MIFTVGEQLSDVVEGLDTERWMDGELWEEIPPRGYEDGDDVFPLNHRVIQED